MHHFHSMYSFSFKYVPVFKGHLNSPKKLTLNDRCPFITGSLNGEDRTLSSHQSNLEDRFYCTKIELEVPFRKGEVDAL